MTPRRPTVVLVAAIVAWLLGLSVLVVEVSFLIVAVGLHPPQWGLYAPLLLGLAYCTSGYLLWIRRVSGAVIAVVFSGLVVALRLEGSGLRLSAILLIHVVFLVLAALAWMELRQPAAVEAGDAAARTPGESS